jgi:hypothetical protein
MAAEVDGMVVGAGVAEDGGEADTTADGDTGMLAIIDGTAVGVGGAVVGTRGGCFRCRCLFLIRITGVTTVQAMGTGMDRVTDTVTESSALPDPSKTHLLGCVVSIRVEYDIIWNLWF